MKLKKTVTLAVRQKNQNNSQKSTGPKTPKGKNASRFNATKHGLTATRLMFGTDGKPVDDHLAEIVEALRDKYGCTDIVAELLIDNVAVDYWRQSKGLDFEIYYLSRNQWSFHPQGSLPTIQRYNTANRRAMLKNLEFLEKLHAEANSDEAGSAEELDDSAETDASTVGFEGASVTDSLDEASSNAVFPCDANTEFLSAETIDTDDSPNSADPTPSKEEGPTPPEEAVA
jgi:hypothetical protein